MTSDNLPCITDARDLEGKRVILRASLNVPIQDGKVVNDHRIREALPTLKYLVDAGARVIILTHVGRDPQNTASPVAIALKGHLGIEHVPYLFGEEVQTAIERLENGRAVLLENVRSDERETANDEAFAALLASYGEVFVNDAFADSHRDHASITGIPRHIPSYIGITFQKEYEELTKALVPSSPSLFILAGAKFETKQKLIEKFANTYDSAFIGGAIANDLLKAKGWEVGASLVSETSLKGDPITEKKNILIPIDAVVEGPNGTRTTEIDGVAVDEKILDVGPASMELLGEYIEKAGTILWNGTLGNYENGFIESTRSCAKRIAESKAHSIIGGGDTVAAIESLGLNDRFGFISTAGGAMLVFLEEGTLPGIEAIRRGKCKEHSH